MSDIKENESNLKVLLEGQTTVDQPNFEAPPITPPSDSDDDSSLCSDASSMSGYDNTWPHDLADDDDDSLLSDGSELILVHGAVFEELGPFPSVPYANIGSPSSDNQPNTMLQTESIHVPSEASSDEMEFNFSVAETPNEASVFSNVIICNPNVWLSTYSDSYSDDSEASNESDE